MQQFRLSTLRRKLKSVPLFLHLICLLGFSCGCTKKKEKPSYGIELSAQEKEDLELFFHDYLKETSLGYVLFGEKPSFTWGALSGSDPICMLGDKTQKKSVYLKKGLSILSSLPINRPNCQFLILQYPGESKGWNEFWVINKKSFKKVFNENKTLFRYILGPSVSAESLLEKFATEKESVAAILKGDRVLFGIILGYGTENALIVSRYEHINEEIDYSEIPLKVVGHHLSPSFGFKTLEEEYAVLNDDKRTTINMYPQSALPELPWFGFVDSPETENLINGYTRTREIIQKHLQSPDLLETILALLLEEKHD